MPHNDRVREAGRGRCRAEDGPFTDDMIRKMLERQKMQHEIIPHIEEMAQKLAAAGVASFMVTGDAPVYAVDQWVRVLHIRALTLLREKMKETGTAQSIKEAAWFEAQKLLDSPDVRAIDKLWEGK